MNDYYEISLLDKGNKTYYLALFTNGFRIMCLDLYTGLADPFTYHQDPSFYKALVSQANISLGYMQDATLKRFENGLKKYYNFVAKELPKLEKSQWN
jgi:hypothetical protein